MAKIISKIELNGRFDSFKAQEINQQIKDEIERMATAGAKANILVDMRHVTFIDSAGLAALVAGMKKAKKYDGKLHLYGLQKTVRIIFELSWLDKAFPIFDSEAAAQAACECE